MTLQYYGMLALPHSWAVVATSILLDIQKRGVSLTAVSTNGNDTIHPHLKSITAQPQLVVRGQSTVLVAKPTPSEVSLSYTIPTNLAKIPATHKIQIYNYETTKLPPGWAGLMKSHAHLILPSSNFSKQIFAMNGIPESRMVVLPHGFDPTLYNPEVLPAQVEGLQQQKFKFLTVAIPHWRKGYDILLQAYIEEFKEDDSVVLVIKTSADPRENDKIPCRINLNELLVNLKQTYKFKWPEIRIISQRFDNLGSLYKAADAVVLPSRTECFSLTMLEASACGVPVITTDYGGHLDFLNHKNSNLIDYKMAAAPREAQYWHFDPTAQIAEPSKEHLKQLMREVRTNHEAAKLRAQQAHQDVQDYTWTKVTDKLLQLIQERGWKI